jgi:putative membrane protein
MGGCWEMRWEKPMIAVGLILACIAVLIHVFIFVVKSLTWTSERTR